MYATCLFCNGALGTNEALEHFPVGRRVAFDAAKGRLWVVCRLCERWNLSPLETRWEAIEEAERVYRDTPTRMSTGNIGMARLSEGTDLVRIGTPMLPEFAAWRYGNQFGSRHRKFWSNYGGMMALQGLGPMGSLLAGYGVLSGETALAFAGVGMTGILGLGARISRQRWLDVRVPTIHTPNNDGVMLRLTTANAFKARIFPTGDGEQWYLYVPHSAFQPAGKMARRFGARELVTSEQLPQRLSGRAAERALASILPFINVMGAGKRVVNDAVSLAITSSSLNHLLRGRDIPKGRGNELFKLNENQRLISYFPEHIRLAMEMSVHEEDERRAMEGELHELEARWREADAIAKIADEMFLSDGVNAKIDDQQRKRLVD